MAKTNHTRAPKRPMSLLHELLQDEAYKRFRGIALMTCDLANGHCGYASAEQFRRAAWYSMHPTLEETGRRSA